MTHSWTPPACRCALALLFALAATAGAQPATLTVTSLADSGTGTLREAITLANADGRPTIIGFAAGLSGGTVALASPLPGLSENGTTIDGDLDADCEPEIALDGSALGDGNPLSIHSSGNHLRGLAFFGFPGCSHGGDLLLEGAGTSGNLVECNWIGLDLAGTAHGGHCFGVKIENGASDNTIGPGNRITAMGGDGIRVEEHANGGYPDFAALTPDRVEVVTPIDLTDDCSFFRRRGGATFFDNGGHPFTENIGLRLTGTLAIATAGTYTFALPSLDDQARLRVDGNVLIDWLGGGTPTPVTLSLTAANHPIRLDYEEGGGAANLKLVVSGPGATALSTDGNTGGCAGGQTGLCGELFQLRVPSERNRITRNALWSNGGQGIGFNCCCGPTANDAGDLDLGPNTVLNKPVLTGVGWAGAPDTYRVTGSAPAGSLVELFIAEGAPDLFGEPKAFLADGTASSGGAFTVDFVSAPETTIPRLTATATDALGNTSEAAANLVFLNGADAVAVGSGAAGFPGQSVPVPIFVRDLLHSPLGLDRAAGLHIQGLLFKVEWSPAAAVASAHFERAGITQALSGFENNTQSGSSASWVASFDESTNAVPFSLDGPAPGDLVAHLVLDLAPDAEPGTLTLTLDPVTALSNQAGTVEETLALGTLTLAGGSFTVASNAARGLYAAPQSASSIRLTWSDPNLAETGFRVERTSDGVTWSPVGTAGPNDTAFLDASGLLPATAYGYRLVTLLPADSHRSNLAVATTFPASAVTLCPTRLSPPRGWARYPSVAWNGSSWAVAWQGRESAFQDQVWFQRFAAADLAPVGSPVAVSASEFGAFTPTIVWNGSRYGVVWQDYLVDQPGGRFASSDFFALLDVDGTKLRGDLRLTSAETQHPFDSNLPPMLAWDGTHWGFFNLEMVSPPMLDLVYRRLDADGDVVVGPVAVLQPAAAHVADVVAAWNATTGEYGLAWWEARDTTMTGYFQRLDEASGTLLGSRTTLDDYPSAIGTYRFDVVADGAGWAVAWTDVDALSGDTATRLQRFAANGDPLGPTVRVSDDPATDWGDPLLQREPGGGFSLFVECDAPNEICRLRTDAAGARLGDLEAITPHDGRADLVAYADVAGNGSDFLVAATDQTTGTLEIAGIRVDATGSSAADPPVALTTGHLAGTGTGTVGPGNATVAPLGAGFVATWTDAATGSSQVQARLWDGTGAPVSVPSPLTSTSANGKPAMFAFGDFFAVAWRQAGSNDLRYGTWSATGTPRGAELSVSTTPGYRAGVAIGFSGEEVALVWPRNGANGMTFLRLDSDGTLQAPEVNVPAGVVAAPPILQWVGSGWVLVWRGSDNNLYYRLLAPDGSSLTANVALTAATQADDPTSNFQILWTGDQLAFAWSEQRSLDPPLEEVYFTRLNLDGSKVFPEVPVVSTSLRDLVLGLYWTPADGRYHLLHLAGQEAGVREITVQPNGTVDPGASFWTYRGSGVMAWNGVTLGMLPSLAASLYFQTSACRSGDLTPPPCPTLAAASVGRKVRLTWNAVTDPQSGLFRYHLHRDGAMLAEIAADTTQFDDGGAFTGTTPSYELRAFDGAYRESTGCTTLAFSTVRGDANGNGSLDVSDVFFLINFFLASGPPPRGDADANGSGGVTTADIFYLINYFYAGGPAPAWSGESRESVAGATLAVKATGTPEVARTEPTSTERRARPVLTLGKSKARAGTTIRVPLVLADVDGSPLGNDRPPGERLQALGFGVRVVPANAAAHVELRRAGRLALASPLFESAPVAEGGAGLVAVFDEIATPLAWSSPAGRGRSEGDLVAEIVLTLSAAAAEAPGGRVELRLDPGTTLLSNQSGTTTESATNGWLRLVDGAVEVRP